MSFVCHVTYEFVFVCHVHSQYSKDLLQSLILKVQKIKIKKFSKVLCVVPLYSKRTQTADSSRSSSRYRISETTTRPSLYVCMKIYKIIYILVYIYIYIDIYIYNVCMYEYIYIIKGDFE